MNARPKKSFGQHFLHEKRYIERIVSAIAPRPEDVVVEIGPGEGALTLPLLASAGKLTAIELDTDLIPGLQARAASVGELRIIHSDVLKVDFTALARERGVERLRIAGNLPYYISSPILFHCVDHAAAIRDMHFMLQKEVVERLAAGPGGGDWGRLSIMVQYHCRVEHLFNVGPGAFNPPPKVDSAIVRLVPHAVLPHPAKDHRLLERVVREAFNQRRKTLRNTLKQLMTAAEIEAAGVDGSLRPEQLDLAAFVRLADKLSEQAPQTPVAD